MTVSASRLTDIEGLSMGLTVGLIIVAVLIAAFVLGARHRDREPEPDWNPQSPGRDAWPTPPPTAGHAPHGDAHAPAHIAYTR